MQGSATDLIESLNEALDLLRDFVDSQPRPGADLGPLPSLVEQCQELSRNQPGPEPLRTVHHLACTGGTLICRLLATLPNTLLLSEIDPLSRLRLDDLEMPRFAPSDLIYGMRAALRPVDDAGVIAVFRAEVKALLAHVGGIGQHLVLRDHAHSHFCTDADIDGRPALREILRDLAPVRSVVTVRHPLDSFVSLDRREWRHFQPFTLDEYARRYTAFLDRHAGLEVIRYEDLVATPEDILARLGAVLDLPFVAGAADLLPAVRMSGDSGRSGDVIAPRPRQDLPEGLDAQARRSPAYEDLCIRLGYRVP
jgi:hypothetical protein